MDVFEAVFTLDEADAWRGNQTHNLGCLCALHAAGSARLNCSKKHCRCIWL